MGDPGEGTGGEGDSLAVTAGDVTVQIFSHQSDTAKQRLKAEGPRSTAVGREGVRSLRHEVCDDAASVPTALPFRGRRRQRKRRGAVLHERSHRGADKRRSLL